MLYALPAAPFLAVLEGAPAGLATLGVQIIAPDGAVLTPRTTAGINEQPPGSGIYNVTLVAPADRGDYLVVWDADGASTTEQLEVVQTIPSPIPPLGLAPWAPSVGEVAQATPAYTRGGYDDDESDELVPGEEHGTFDEGTSPTRTDVEGYIAAACDEVLGRVGTAIPAEHYGLARAAAKWHVAAVIAGGKRPAGTDDASGEYRSHVGNYRACLDRLVELVTRGATRLA